jgi:hypothetical protein
MRLKFKRASDLCRPTVNKQLDAGNEAAVVRGEENGGLAGLPLFSLPFYRRQRGDWQLPGTDVRLWHKADMLIARNVRYWG